MTTGSTMGVRVASALALAWVLLCGGAAWADDDEARVKFKEGVELYQGGKYVEAAAAFEKAYALKPIYKLLFNIGQAHAAARNYDLAIQAFERYLVDAGDDVSEERRSEVLAEIAKLRPLVGFLEVEAPPGLLVEVDGRERGRTPLKSKLMLTVGHPHKVTLTDGEAIVLEQDVKVFGGVVETVRVSGAEPAAAVQDETTDEPADGPQPMVDEEEATPGLRLWGWITLGAGAAVAVAGGIVGGVALSQSSKLETACPDGGCSPARESEIAALDGQALTADILIGVGAAAAVAGGVMLIVAGVNEGEDDGAEARLLPGPGGVTLDVSF